MGKKQTKSQSRRKRRSKNNKKQVEQNTKFNFFLSFISSVSSFFLWIIRQLMIKANVGNAQLHSPNDKNAESVGSVSGSNSFGSDDSNDTSEREASEDVSTSNHMLLIPHSSVVPPRNVSTEQLHEMIIKMKEESVCRDRKIKEELVGRDRKIHRLEEENKAETSELRCEISKLWEELNGRKDITTKGEIIDSLIPEVVKSAVELNYCLKRFQKSKKPLRDIANHVISKNIKAVNKHENGIPFEALPVIENTFFKHKQERNEMSHKMTKGRRSENYHELCGEIQSNLRCKVPKQVLQDTKKIFSTHYINDKKDNYTPEKQKQFAEKKYG